jgi:L-seryl-tRNA(Ser) seleniumtransferase
MSNLLPRIPSLSELLESPPLKSLVNRASHNVVVSTARKFLEELRTQVQTATANVRVPAPAELAQRIADWISVEGPSALVPVINATGVVLADELGRAPLAEEALEAIAAVSRGSVNLEINLATGQPVSRGAAVEAHLTRLSGAEAAVVVNNNTGAMLIALAALSAGREVIVSRGQLAETADGCRLVEIMTASGAVLREVGATNRTRLEDYAAAISPVTAALLRVERSGYEIVGEVEEPTLAELVVLGRKHNLPVIDNVDTGAVLDFSAYGVRGQSQVADSVRAGADLVLFSGDRLLGGPQCGLIVGRRRLVQTIGRHPLYRALHVDKIRLAALAATLRLFADLELAERAVPVITLLATPLENLRQRAERMAPQLAAAGVANVEVLEGQARVFGNSLVGQMVPTICLALAPHSGTAEQLAARLRGGTLPVIGRVEGERVVLDLRSVPPRDDLALVAAIEALRPPAGQTDAPTGEAARAEHLADEN